eukprot:TRINITY_DN8376_c0_g1_i2.p4 TRINITY_DN8376_c0_g1~~TRINITY_DN8376_c0_g1_i2.p4  ORF type:complete len:104 (-),score=3.34 TRINITY_DN8376_c0_g1_i2:666-977(-)
MLSSDICVSWSCSRSLNAASRIARAARRVTIRLQAARLSCAGLSATSARMTNTSSSSALTVSTLMFSSTAYLKASLFVSGSPEKARYSLLRYSSPYGDSRRIC